MNPRSARPASSVLSHEEKHGGDGDERLLAQMIHDLKNPLGVILCYAEILPDATESERDEYSRRLYANARALLDLLDGFALLSDLRRGEAELAVETVDWVRLILKVVAEVEPVARFRDQRVACDTVGEQKLCGDRTKLALAVRHLLLEALRLSPPGETIRVQARAESDGVSLHVVVSGERGSTLAFDRSRPTMELVERVVRLHRGTLSCDAQPQGAVGAIYIRASGQ